MARHDRCGAEEAAMTAAVSELPQSIRIGYRSQVWRDNPDLVRFFDARLG